MVSMCREREEYQLSLVRRLRGVKRVNERLRLERDFLVDKVQTWGGLDGDASTMAAAVAVTRRGCLDEVEDDVELLGVAPSDSEYEDEDVTDLVAPSVRKFPDPADLVDVMIRGGADRSASNAEVARRVLAAGDLPDADLEVAEAEAAAVHEMSKNLKGGQDAAVAMAVAAAASATAAPGSKEALMESKVPKKPVNAFILFLNSFGQDEMLGPDGTRLTMSERTKVLSARWKAMTPVDKEVFYARQRKDQERYEEELKAYEAKLGIAMGGSEAAKRRRLATAKNQRKELEQYLADQRQAATSSATPTEEELAGEPAKLESQPEQLAGQQQANDDSAAAAAAAKAVAPTAAAPPASAPASALASAAASSASSGTEQPPS